MNPALEGGFLDFPTGSRRVPPCQCEFNIENAQCLARSAGEDFSLYNESKFRVWELCHSCISPRTKGFDKVAWFLHVRKSAAAPCFAGAYKRGRMKSEYDSGSAITFLLLGLGIGSALACVQSETKSRTRRNQGNQ